RRAGKWATSSTTSAPTDLRPRPATGTTEQDPRVPCPRTGRGDGPALARESGPVRSSPEERGPGVLRLPPEGPRPRASAARGPGEPRIQECQNQYAGAARSRSAAEQGGRDDRLRRSVHL